MVETSSELGSILKAFKPYSKAFSKSFISFKTTLKLLFKWKLFGKLIKPSWKDLIEWSNFPILKKLKANKLYKLGFWLFSSSWLSIIEIVFSKLPWL